ncbi:metal ABC transporter substrate-binding protein [Microbulbifer aggregans]|uniref:metal ABC transporter substrate-binding protein n=1 Tax=Microbulbifer aggregans TaxID=1769779 RepID=UPI001CFE1F2B|nr:metal ABC transporter substrate-binding protein [Microbulbifer aggregans]
MLIFPRSQLQFCLVLLSFLLLLATGCDRSEKQTLPEKKGQLLIVTSIHPISMITREIAGSDSEIMQIVGSGDPHHYAPKVTDRAAIERAQLVVWMGPAMEAVLARQMAQVPANQQLELLSAGGYEYEGADSNDPHLWLRPRNAAVMAAHIATRLAELDPDKADGYRQRARDFSRAMANLQKVQDRALWAYRDVPIITTHQAYGHFFGPAGVVVESLGTSASHQHGARTMLEKGAATNAAGGVGGCLFGEVPANDRDRQTAEHLGLDYQPLDPLGTELPPESGYQQLMEKLLADARLCLSRVPDGSGKSAD